MAKVLVTIPDDLLARIDGAAERSGCTRSGWLRRVAEESIRRDHAEVDELLRRIRERLADRGPYDSAAEIRRQRDELDARDRSR